MIDPSIIDERISKARDRDSAVSMKLLGECARLTVIAPNLDVRMLDLNSLTTQLLPARLSHSGVPQGSFQPTPENGSYAYQLYSAICFAIDARAELKLLELIASPDFYASLMRSAAEVPAP